jgi:hypothetical protein
MTGRSSPSFSGPKGGVVLSRGPCPARAPRSPALCLTPQEQDTIRREIVGKLGSGSTITFRVDTRLLGGLVISVGDKTLDGSVLGGLEGLRQSLR